MGLLPKQWYALNEWPELRLLRSKETRQAERQVTTQIGQNSSLSANSFHEKAG
jgi:hypothetical protein